MAGLTTFGALILVILIVVVVGVVLLVVLGSRSKQPPPVRQGQPMPGWYPDPGNPNALRYFDGHAWTPATRPPG